MPNADQRLMTGAVTGMAAMVLAWITVWLEPAGAAAGFLHAGLWLLLLGPAAMLAGGVIEREPAPALLGLFILGVPFGIAAGWLHPTPLDAITLAYAAVPVIGFAAAMVLLVRDRRDTRRNREAPIGREAPRGQEQALPGADAGAAD